MQQVKLLTLVGIGTRVNLGGVTGRGQPVEYHKSRQYLLDDQYFASGISTSSNNMFTDDGVRWDSLTPGGF